MNLKVSEKLRALAQKAPFPLYIVGGAVRDALADLPASPDVDLCAPAPAEQLSALAQEAGIAVNGVYKTTGTVNMTDGENKLEFTSFRTDRYGGGEHAPSSVKFTKDIRKDALRRDFKCNAVYYNIRTGELADPLGGISDIENRRITTTRDADEVFAEDGLRLMRLARQAAQLGFVPTVECILGAKFNAARIAKIVPERIFAELQLILHADEKYGRTYAHYEGLQVLEATDVLAYILPELAAGKGMAQRSDFHAHDVLEHSLRTCKYADKSIRLAALLHDVRLKAPKKVTDLVCRLTALHMYDLDGKAREGKVRSFIVKNYDVYEPLLLLKQADYSGCKDDLAPCPTLVKWRGIEEKMRAEGVPFTLKELAVRGDALRGILPAEQTGRALEALLLWCAQDGRRNEKGALLREAARLAKEFAAEQTDG